MTLSKKIYNYLYIFFLVLIIIFSEFSTNFAKAKTFVIKDIEIQEKYDLNFDKLITDTDEFFEDKGVKIIVDKKSLFYVLGTELDFSDGLNGKGFQFKNPNATRTCGCGESFSV